MSKTRHYGNTTHGRISGWMAALLLSLPGAAPVAATSLALECRPQPEPAALLCRYEPPPGTTTLPTAQLETGASLSLDYTRRYAATEDPVALLVLVDVSDPGRDADVRRSRDLTASLADFLPASFPLGLASFAGGIDLRVHLGTDRTALREALSGIEAVGLTTELYRSVLQGIETLSLSDTPRRRLLIFSDGLAEDVAYGHDDAVRAAREAGVIITGLGLPRTPALSVALQSLRRLAEETGGAYREVASTSPDWSTVLGDFDSGGELQVDLSPVQAGSPATNIEFTVELEQFRATRSVAYTPPPAAPQPVVVQAPAAEPVTADLPVQGPVPAMTEAKPVAEAVPVEEPAVAPVAPPAKGLTEEKPAPPVSRPVATPWTAGSEIPAAAGLLALLVFGAGLWGWRRRQRRGTQVASTGAEAGAPGGPPPTAPIAFLVAKGLLTHHPIWRVPCRLGRAPNNDVVLNDNSVSRHHAEIERRPDGGFGITDLDSLNGIYIEGKRLDQGRLFEGCQIDVGDLSFRFTLIDPASDEQQATVMIRTDAPPTEQHPLLTGARH